MTDKNTKTPAEDDQNQAPGLPLTIHSQYVKDLSFENPNAPFSLRAGQPAPEMDIDINLDAQKIESDKLEHFYEVSMTLRVTASREGKSVYILELVYGAAVSLSGVKEEQHGVLLMVQTPHQMFPYARNIVFQTVVNGGFPALFLNPINFRQMFLQNYGKPEDGSGLEDTPEDIKENA